MNIFKTYQNFWHMVNVSYHHHHHHIFKSLCKNLRLIKEKWMLKAASVFFTKHFWLFSQAHLCPISFRVRRGGVNCFDHWNLSGNYVYHFWEAASESLCVNLPSSLSLYHRNLPDSGSSISLYPMVRITWSRAQPPVTWAWMKTKLTVLSH